MMTWPMLELQEDLSISLFSKMDPISKIKLKESAMPSQVRDMILKILIRFLSRLKQSQIKLLLLSRLMKWQGLHLKSNCLNLIKSKLRLITIQVQTHHQQFTFTKCSLLEKKLFIKIWIWWNGKTKASSVSSGLLLTKKMK